jgi:Cu(I)/Ag(I) efflux system periplasmic protein CusF
MPISSPRRPVAWLLTWLLIMLSATLSLSCRQSPQAANTGESPPPVPWKTIEPPTQIGDAGGTPTTPPPVVVGRPYLGTGIVIIVNRKEGWVEINHEAIEGLMPAMQMEWSVKDRAMLKSIRVGDKVNFTIVETGGGEIITELKRAPVPR